jgi:hypothetical protein
MLRETQIRERRNLRFSLIMSCRIIIRVKLQNFRRWRSVGYIGSRCNKERKVVRVWVWVWVWVCTQGHL